MARRQRSMLIGSSQQSPVIWGGNANALGGVPIQTYTITNTSAPAPAQYFSAASLVNS